MIRERILKALEQGPMTLDALSELLSIPRVVLRSVLTLEFYAQREVVHKDHGRMTVWSVDPSARIEVDGIGRYHLVSSG